MKTKSPENLRRAFYLENERKWPEWMIENSLQWAKAHGKWRVSPIHGADEWELPLDEEFSNAIRQSETQTSSTSVAVQDTPARLHVVGNTC